MTQQEYVYRVVEVVRVVDADTFWLQLSVGFRQTQLAEIRLLGYDCPERRRGTAFEKSEAVRATVLATAWLDTALPAGLWVRTEKDPDNFGRWLGEVWRDDGEHLGVVLRDAGLASVWPTRWHTEFDQPATPHAGQTESEA